MDDTNDPPSDRDPLSDPGALRQEMRDKGYVLLRGLIDRDVIEEIGRSCLSKLRMGGIPVGDENDRYSFDWTAMPGDFAARRAEVMPSLFGLEDIHRMFHSEPLVRLGRSLTGEDETFVHTHKQVRVQPPAPPNEVAQSTGAHQDHVYNQGSPEMYTVWVPLGNVEPNMGGLEVLPRSHLGGVREGDETLSAGSITYHVKSEPSESEWFRPEYSAGDCIAFHSLTLHRASPNSSRRIRLSADCRYQAMSQPFAAELLEPLEGVIESYPDWRSKELQYYWRGLPLKKVPWHPERIPGMDPTRHMKKI